MFLPHTYDIVGLDTYIFKRYENVKQKSIRGLPTVSFETIKVCEGCLYRKISHKSFSPSSTNITKPLQLVHSDLCGPFSIPSMSGATYFITFIDNTTRFTVLSPSPLLKLNISQSHLQLKKDFGFDQ